MSWSSRWVAEWKRLRFRAALPENDEDELVEKKLELVLLRLAVDCDFNAPGELNGTERRM